MIDSILHSHMVQLCTQGFLERISLKDGGSSLLELLDKLDISFTESKQKIEIESEIELINLESIQTNLSEIRLLDSYDWQYRLATDSTNADALRLFREGRQHCVVVAEMQTGGRGRRGRAWVSPFAKNIYCTIGMQRSIRDCNPGLLSIVAGIALCKALQSCGIYDVRLKWPNDLYYQNQKLGGILIESRMNGSDEYFFAIGIGINVLMDDRDFHDIPQPATSIKLNDFISVTRDQILVHAIRHVIQMIDEFDASKISKIIAAFDAIDAFRNAPISVTTAQQSIDGVNAGIDSSGQLLLDTDDGQLEFSAADVSLRGRA